MPLPRLLTRRRFFTVAGAGLAGAGAYAFGVEPHLVTVVRRDLPIEHLPQDLEGKRLVQLSDLHLGPVGADYLLKCFDRVARLRPLIDTASANSGIDPNMLEAIVFLESAGRPDAR